MHLHLDVHRYLQSLITTPLMNRYLRAHVDRYAQKTCTTYEFQQFFIAFAKENGVKDEVRHVLLMVYVASMRCDMCRA